MINKDVKGVYRDTRMSKVDIKELFACGAHFGHKTSRWHPKMAPYIHSKRDGNHVIDLAQTVQKLEEALTFVTQVVAGGRSVLLVGTKKQAKDTVRQAAEKTAMPFVTERWLGGMLTNRSTMGGRIKHLKKLEEDMASGKLESKYNKLEVQRYQEEIKHMNHIFGGIKAMNQLPAAVFITDVLHDINALREARKLQIPIIAVVDTNADPSNIDYVIPANDDAIKSISYITDQVVAAIQAGKQKAAKKQELKDESEEK